jgi:poly(A) polymerase
MPNGIPISRQLIHNPSMVEAGAKAPCNRDDALAVLLRLRDAGHEAYFAGGCVRDMLLGLAPSDFDVATSAPPKAVQTLFSNAQAVGAAFGVILVRHGGSQIEVATFRSDGQYLDGRHPVSVNFSTAEEDAQRRDFTVNALFYDPVHDKVIDYVGGREDLQNHLIRAVGTPAARFDEDHLRMLRAIRFAARFGFSVEPKTAEALTLHASRIISISPERIADELRRMLTAPTRGAAWPMLFQFNLASPIFRHTLENVAAAGNRAATLHPNNSIFLSVEPGAKISFALALAAAALDLTRDSASSDLRPLLAKPNVM